MDGLVNLYACIYLYYTSLFTRSHSTPVTPHSSLLSLITNPHTGTTVAQTTDGTLLRYSATEGLLPWLLPSGAELKFPEQSCDHTTLAIFREMVFMIVYTCSTVERTCMYSCSIEIISFSNCCCCCLFVCLFTSPGACSGSKCV